MTSPSLQAALPLVPDVAASLFPPIVPAFQDQGTDRWDGFVSSHPAGTFFHQGVICPLTDKPSGTLGCSLVSVTGLGPLEQ